MVPQKFRHKTTLWSSSSVSGYISPKRIESKDLNRYLYTYVQSNIVHSNIIHSSPKVETTQMFIPEWVDNQDVIYTFNKLLFNLKTFIIRMKLWHTLQYEWRQCVKEKKPDTKGWIRFDSAYKGYLKQIKFLERKTNGGCQGLGEEENGELLFNE